MDIDMDLIISVTGIIAGSAILGAIAVLLSVL